MVAALGIIQLVRSQRTVGLVSGHAALARYPTQTAANKFVVLLAYISTPQSENDIPIIQRFILVTKSLLNSQSDKYTIIFMSNLSKSNWFKVISRYPSSMMRE